jgi:hypothetical protein
LFKNIAPIKAFLNHHYVENFNATNCLTVLKFLSTNKLINQELISLIPEIFNKVVEASFQTREAFKNINNDEILMFIKDYKFTNLPLNQFTISKYLVLYFEDENLLDYVYSLENRKDLLEHLTNNVTAYYHFYNNIPKAFSPGVIKKHYQKQRKNIINNETELQFFLTIFKCNKMFDYEADILNNWKTKDTISLNFNLADFILNSKLRSGRSYFDELTKLHGKDQSDKNGSKLVQNTLAYLKDGNENFAVTNFLENLGKRINSLKDNDGQLLNLLLQAEGPEQPNPDKEFKYVLERHKLIEIIKSDLRTLFTNIKYQSKTSFEANEKIAKYISNGFTSNNKGSYVDELLSNIKENLVKLKNIRYEDITDEVVEDSMEVVSDKLKVLLFLEKRRYKNLFFLLGKDIQAFNELNKLEINQQDKEAILKKIKSERSRYSGDDLKFLDLLSQFVEYKAEDFKKVVISEHGIRNLDNSILQGYDLNEYLKKAKEIHSRSRNKYYKVKSHSILDNIKYLEDNLSINPLQVESHSKSKNIENLKSNLDKYKKLLDIINKTSTPRFKLFKYINTEVYPRHFNHKMKDYIFNNKTYQDKLIKFIMKRLYTQVVYYPQRLKNNRYQFRSIIQAYKNKFSSNLFDYIKFHTKLNPDNDTIMNKIFDKLESFEKDLINKKDEELFIENLFKQMCGVQGVKLDLHQKPVKDRNEQLMNLKGFLGQDQTVLDYKYAVYMILFGIENNLPLGNIIFNT